jgi:hypothetical protein
MYVRTEEGHNLRSIKSTNKILNFKNTTGEKLHVRSPVITEAPTFLQKPPLDPSYCDCTSSHSFVHASNTDQLLHPQTAESIAAVVRNPFLVRLVSSTRTTK